MQCAPSVQNWCEEMLCFVSFNTSAGLFKFLLKLLHWWELGILWGKSCKNLQVPIAQTDWKSFGSEPSHRNYTKAQEHLDAQCPKLNSKAPKSRRNRGIPSEDASRRTGTYWCILATTSISQGISRPFLKAASTWFSGHSVPSISWRMQPQWQVQWGEAALPKSGCWAEADWTCTPNFSLIHFSSPHGAAVYQIQLRAAVF